MFNKDQAKEIAEKLGVKFDKFPLEDFLTGLNIELEHGLADPATNVTNDDPILTGKIALAHLNEFPDYYDQYYGLPAMERALEAKQNTSTSLANLAILLPVLMAASARR